MITAVKGNIYVLNDEIRKIIIEVNSNPVIQKTKKLRKITEEEAAVEDAIPEEPHIERAVEDYDDNESQCDIAH